MRLMLAACLGTDSPPGFGTSAACKLRGRACLASHRASHGLPPAASPRSLQPSAPAGLSCVSNNPCRAYEPHHVRCQTRPCRLSGADWLRVCLRGLSAASAPTLQARQDGMLRCQSRPCSAGMASAVPTRPLPHCGRASPAGSEEPDCRGVRHHLSAACGALCALRAPGAAADSAGRVGGSLQG